MKTRYPLEEIQHFLNYQNSASLIIPEQLTEGHSSQVVAFTEANGARRVLRIREDYEDLLADKFAYDNFGSNVPIPAVIDIGKFDTTNFYCIAERASGKIIPELTDTELNHALPQIRKTFADIFCVDISNFTGYGDINPITGDGAYSSWGESLTHELNNLDISLLPKYAESIGLPAELSQAFIGQFVDNLPYVSEDRSLLHGDPGGDNMLIENGNVTGIIDWEQMAYGDWLRDFSRFSFWGKYNYGNPEEFAHEFNLDNSNIPQRIAAYWAIHALRNIEFAATQKNDKVAEWMRLNAHAKIV